MGYGYYLVGDRPAGYMVLANCDARGCDEEITRGRAYLCGDHPHRPGIDDGPGCGRYYCGRHLGFVGPRGGCKHPRPRGPWRAWGRVLSCMAPDAEGTVCLDPAGHDGLHAWALTDA